ncbi:hypothetical protein PCL_01580, partial [Purpureocillium lilacinum]
MRTLADVSRPAAPVEARDKWGSKLAQAITVQAPGQHASTLLSDHACCLQAPPARAQTHSISGSFVRFMACRDGRVADKRASGERPPPRTSARAARDRSQEEHARPVDEIPARVVRVAEIYRSRAFPCRVTLHACGRAAICRRLGGSYPTPGPRANSTDKGGTLPLVLSLLTARVSAGGARDARRRRDLQRVALPASRQAATTMASVCIGPLRARQSAAFALI